MKYGLIIIIALSLLSCSKQTLPDNKILIEIDQNNEIRIEGELILIDDLNKELASQIEEMETDGISREEIITKLIVDENAKMGVVSALQQTMRELNLRKVEYTPRKNMNTVNS